MVGGGLALPSNRGTIECSREGGGGGEREGGREEGREGGRGERRMLSTAQQLRTI